jgi:exodeoxyribonuclease VII small subunit
MSDTKPQTEAPAQAQPPAPAQAQPPAPARGPADRQTYETASTRVEEIIRRLDSGEASLNETLDLVKEGKGLIEFCAAELESVAGALDELRLDELVARLDGESGRSGTSPTGHDGPGGPASSSDGGTGSPAEVIKS